MQIPASNLLADRLPRFVGNGRAEVDEVLAVPILRPPRLKPIAQKIELLVRVSPSPVIILAVDNLRLLRMKLQPAFLHARGYRCSHLLRLRFRPAMHDRIVGIPFERQLRILPPHPHIEPIMQKQIRQQGADDSALRRALPTLVVTACTRCTMCGSGRSEIFPGVCIARPWWWRCIACDARNAGCWSKRSSNYPPRRHSASGSKRSWGRPARVPPPVRWRGVSTCRRPRCARSTYATWNGGTSGVASQP